jgi:hypothetical protein
LPGLVSPLRLVLQQVGVFQADHAGARAAGQDHGFVRFKDLDGSPGQRGRLVAKTAVEKWLATTGLLGRELDLATGPPQELDGGDAHFREKLIDQASDKKRDPNWLVHGLYFNCPFSELLTALAGDKRIDFA